MKGYNILDVLFILPQFQAAPKSIQYSAKKRALNILFKKKIKLNNTLQMKPYLFFKAKYYTQKKWEQKPSAL